MLGHGENGWSAELQGEITALVALGLSEGKAHRGLQPSRSVGQRWLRGEDLDFICRLQPKAWSPPRFEEGPLCGDNKTLQTVPL